MDSYDKILDVPTSFLDSAESALAPDRFARLLRVMSVIQTHGGVEGQNLSTLAGVSRRTFFRDLQMLREAGVPVAYSRRSRSFTIDGGYFLGPINLDSAETEALALAFVMLEGQQTHPWVEPLRRAEAKIFAALNEEHRPAWNAVLRNSEVVPPPACTAEPIADVFARIHQAINESRELTVEIDLPEDVSRTITLRPLALAFVQVRWYLVAQTPDPPSARLYPLDRIVRLTLSARHFDSPGPIRLHSQLGHAWRIECGAVEYPVEVRFDARVAEEVEMLNWHATQETHWEEGGTLLFRAQVAGLSEVARWVLGYGPLAEVLGPPDLRTLIQTMAQQTAALYASVPQPAALPAAQRLTQS